jgi:hypothetical protein
MFPTMRTIFQAAAVVCLAHPLVQAQTAPASSLPAGTTIRVTLEKPLSAKKNKSGDQVIVKSVENIKSDGHNLLPKGSKILGHLTTVKARTKDNSETVLAMVFDRAVLKDRREMPLHLVIQAVAPGQENSIPTMSMTPATAAGSGGGMGPVTGPLTAGSGPDPNAGAPRITSPESPMQSPEDNIDSRGDLTPTCRGVLRMEGVVLAPEDSTLGSIIVSRNANIQLDIGTQMMLRVPED